MNPWTRHEYNRLRALGWTASDALRSARIKDRFSDLENDGLVKLELEPECDFYDDSYLESCGLTPDRLAREREDLRNRIERDGHWILVAYYRADDESEWIAADSCGGFIGDDWKDSGYDTDLRSAAIDAIEAITQREADSLATRATYAIGGI